MGVTEQHEESAFATTSIDVNIDGLSDFKGFLSRELNLNLVPGSDEVLNDHTIGVRFGARNPGFNVRAATTTYYTTLSVSASNLQEYVHSARGVIDLIEAVMEKYRLSDLTAAGSTSLLDSALEDRFGHPLPGPTSASSTETDRETYRGSGHAAISPA